jgi:hypothetical protein
MPRTPEQIAEYKRQWYLKNKERMKAAAATRYQANKEDIRNKQKEYYNAKKDKICNKVKEYQKSNKARVDEYKRQWYTENKAYVAKKASERYEANKDEISKKASIYRKSHGAIKSKLNRHRDEDIKKGRDFNITYDYVKELLEEQGNECAQCFTEVKLSWTDKYDPAQFSINRIKNKYGHIVGNVEICCLQCNRTYRSK